MCPTYDYKCCSCEHIQEEFHGMKESPKIKCEKCGGKSKKHISTNYQMNMGENWGTSIDEALEE